MTALIIIAIVAVSSAVLLAIMVAVAVWVEIRAGEIIRLDSIQPTASIMERLNK